MVDLDQNQVFLYHNFLLMWLLLDNFQLGMLHMSYKRKEKTNLWLIKFFFFFIHTTLVDTSMRVTPLLLPKSISLL